jgi:membrane protease YdiL (CAAX protease family)
LLQADIEQVLRPEVALTGAILVAGVAAFAPLTIAIAKRLYPGRIVFFARWGFSHVLLGLFVFLALSLVVAKGLVPDSGEGEPPLELVLTASAFVQGVVVALIAYWAAKRDPEGVRSLGLWPGNWARALGVGLLVYLLFLPGIFGLELCWPWLVTRLGETFEPQSIEAGFLELAGLRLWVAIALAVFVLPLFEEVLFRAFLQPLLVQNFRDYGGVVLTSVIFAGLHGTSAFLPIFGLSLVLGGVMLRTQRLIAVWGIHAAHNGIQVALLLLL